MSNIMELADAYAEAKVELGIGVSAFGKDSKLTRHRATLHDEARAALEAAVKELEKDAARYRRLREQVYIDADKRLRIARTYLIKSGIDTTAEMLDAAIDAARSEK